MPSSKFTMWNTGGLVEPTIQKITKDFEDSDLDEMIQAVMAIKYNRIYQKSAKSMTTINEQADNLINSLADSKDMEYITSHKSGIKAKLKLLIESIDRYKTTQQSIKTHPNTFP